MLMVLFGKLTSKFCENVLQCTSLCARSISLFGKTKSMKGLLLSAVFFFFCKKRRNENFIKKK